MEKVHCCLHSYFRSLRRWWKPPKPGQILIEAAEIHKTVSAAAALDFLATQGQPSQLSVGYLLRANDATDDASWQLNVNTYLAKYCIEPVKLVAGGRKRFYRLSSEVKFFVNDGPLVSIIMTTYNAQETVEHSIKSILGQTWRNIELVVVDDGSTDRTWEVLKEMAARDGRVRIFRNGANVGPYVSKNVGLSFVTGEYFTCHDADDWAHPQRLQRQMEAVTANSASVGNVALWLRATEDLQFRKFGGIGSNDTDGIAHISLISCLFRRDAFRNRLGYWDSVRFAADHELFRRCRAVFGKEFSVLTIVSAFALDAEGSLTNHPLYGTRAGPKNRVSLPRAEYQRHWEAWHRRALPAESCLEFPHSKRKFAAPEIMLPPPESIECVIKAAFDEIRSSTAEQAGVRARRATEPRMQLAPSAASR